MQYYFRDFFSKFCFLVRGVAKESSHLETELQTLNNFLESSSCERGEGGFLCGSCPSLLDCEILPKLHQVRVAAQALKGYCNLHITVNIYYSVFYYDTK